MKFARILRFFIHSVSDNTAFYITLVDSQKYMNRELHLKSSFTELHGDSSLIYFKRQDSLLDTMKNLPGVADGSVTTR